MNVLNPKTQNIWELHFPPLLLLKCSKATLDLVWLGILGMEGGGPDPEARQE